eukprot:g770.t1 g770   contig10:697679-698923(+)
MILSKTALAPLLFLWNLHVARGANASLMSKHRRTLTATHHITVNAVVKSNVLCAPKPSISTILKSILSCRYCSSSLSCRYSSRNMSGGTCFVQPANNLVRRHHHIPRPPSTFTRLASSYQPNWERITNHQTSKTVKLFKSIHRANKSKRSDLGLTVAEGVRLVTDILSNEQSRRLIRRIIVSESLVYGDNSGGENEHYQQQLQHWLRVAEDESKQRKAEHDESGGEGGGVIDSCTINIGTDQVLTACSGTVTTQGVVALMEIPRPYDPLSDTDVPSKEMPPFYLILDGLSDPGNVGTLLRSCAASQVTALILLPNSCDVWNPKAVRSAMGASFRVPVLELTNADDKDGALDQVLSILEQCGVDGDRVFAATMDDSEDGQKKSLAHFQVDWIRHTKDDSKSGGGSAIILGREGKD